MSSVNAHGTPKNHSYIKSQKQINPFINKISKSVNRKVNILWTQNNKTSNEYYPGGKTKTATKITKSSLKQIFGQRRNQTPNS